MSLDSMKEIFDLMAEKNKPFWEVVLEDDMETRQTAIRAASVPSAVW